MAVLGEAGAEGIPDAGIELLQCGVERDLPVPHRGAHPDVGDPGTDGSGLQVNVATQPAPGHSTLDLSGRGSVVVREHDGLQGHGQDEQTEPVPTAGTAGRRQLHFAAGKPDLAGRTTVHEDRRVGIQVLDG